MRKKNRQTIFVRHNTDKNVRRILGLIETLKQLHNKRTFVWLIFILLNDDEGVSSHISNTYPIYLFKSH